MSNTPTNDINERYFDHYGKNKTYQFVSYHDKYISLLFILFFFFFFFPLFYFYFFNIIFLKLFFFNL